MRIAFLFVLLCVPRFAFAQALAAAPAARAFDGTWAVTLVVPNHTDEQGTALGFTFHFMATVKDGAFHGEYGLKDNPPWLSIDGPIHPDGSAEFAATGITGKAAYNLHKLGSGVPYNYQVKAHFEGAKGTGSRVSGRIGNFTFTKQ